MRIRFPLAAAAAALLLCAGAVLPAQSPQDVVRSFEHAAFSDLMGRRTTWRVHVQNHMDPAAVAPILARFRQEQEQALKDGDGEQGKAKKLKGVIDSLLKSADIEMEVIAAFDAPDRWKITWWQLGEVPSLVDEVSCDGISGVIIELTNRRQQKNVVQDAWPTLGCHLRGVPAVFAAAKLNAGSDLAFDDEGNLKFKEPKIGHKSCLINLDRGRFALAGFVGWDAAGVAREKLYRVGDHWVWETIYTSRTGETRPLQRQEWILRSSVPLRPDEDIFAHAEP